jgi:Uma2 family endonuclease
MQSGVEEYWIVNPFSEEINIYWFKERDIEKTITFKTGEKAVSFAFPGLSIDVDGVFGKW